MSTTKTTSLTAEEAEKLLQEAPLYTTLKYSEAVDLYSEIVDGISLNESDASLKQILSRALSNRSGCFLGMKKSKEALEVARRCVDVRPSWARSHLRVAAAAAELEEFDLSISAYEAAMKAEDRSGKVPSAKELEAEILGIVWKKKKPKAEKHCFLSDLVVASGVAETDAKKLFSFFDQPFTQFFDLSESDIAAILGIQQQSKIDKILQAKKNLQVDDLDFRKFIVLEENNNNNNDSSDSAAKQEKKISKSTICDLIQIAHNFWGSNFRLPQLHSRIARTGFIITPKYGVITHDIYLFIAIHVADSDTAFKFTDSLYTIISKDDSMFPFLCCVELQDALLKMSTFVDFSRGPRAQAWSRIFGNMYELGPSHRKSLLNTEKVRDNLVGIIDQNTKTFESSYYVMATMAYFVQEDQELYFVPSVINCLVSSAQYANTAVSLFAILFAIERMTSNNKKVTQRLTLCSELKEIILNIIPKKLQLIASSGGSGSQEFGAAKSFCKCLQERVFSC